MIVPLDITDKEQIVGKFSRVLNILDYKVTLHWKNTLVLYHFCNKEEHTRKNCPDFIESKKGKSILNELKEAQKTENSDSQSSAKETVTSTITKNVEKNSFIVHKDNTFQIAPEVSSLFEEAQKTENSDSQFSAKETVTSTITK